MHALSAVYAGSSCWYAPPSSAFSPHARIYYSLAWPDPIHPGAYRLEIISTGILGSGIVHRVKANKDHQVLVGDD